MSELNWIMGGLTGANSRLGRAPLISWPEFKFEPARLRIRRSLCASELFIIAILDFSDREAEWLWDGLRDGVQAQVIVIFGRYPERRAQKGWTVESIEQPQAAVLDSKRVAKIRKEPE